MGSSLSQSQEAVILNNAGQSGKIVLMLDEDDAGRAWREDALRRLARWSFVKVITFPNQGQQPDNLSQEELVTLLGSESPERGA